MEKMYKKEQLVLIPGLNNTAQIWDDLEQHLPDYLQCTKITNPPLNRVEDIAEELLKTLPDKFFLVGYSFGGFVALSMLDIAPERIKGLILISTSPTADSDERIVARDKAIQKANAGMYKEMINSQAEKIFYYKNLGNPRFKRLRKKMLDDYGKERFIAHQKASQKRSNRIESLRNFKKPILYAIGTDDKLFSLKDQKENLHGISDVTYKEIKESGHMMPVEQANELAHTIEDWINERIFN